MGRRGEGRGFAKFKSTALSKETPRLDLSHERMGPRRSGPPLHEHAGEDDAFLMLEGELVFTVDGEEVVAGPGTFLLVPPGIEHSFENRCDEPARFVNVHAPAGFDLRLRAS